MLEIRKESPTNTAPGAKAYGLWDDGLRYDWFDTYEEALDAARTFLRDAQTEANEAWDRADEIETYIKLLEAEAS